MGETYCFHHKSLFMQFLPFEGNFLTLDMLVYYHINNHILSICHFDWASFEGVLAFYSFVCSSHLCILSYIHVPYGAFFINKEFEFEFINSLLIYLFNQKILSCLSWF
jgi:hypothetical protein